MASPDLRLSESIQLVSAFATHLAEAQSIRVLLLKGPQATAMGVRGARPSVNVDVWVEPVCFAYYLSILKTHGWHRMSHDPNSSGSAPSVSLSHLRWLCTLEVHQALPGFRGSADAAFDAVWNQRDYVVVGTQEAPIPGVVPAAAIAVLNHARSSDLLPETRDDVDLALERVALFGPDQAAALRELARSTDSTDALARLLDALPAGDPGQQV